MVVVSYDTGTMKVLEVRDLDPVAVLETAHLDALVPGDGGRFRFLRCQVDIRERYLRDRGGICSRTQLPDDRVHRSWDGSSRRPRPPQWGSWQYRQQIQVACCQLQRRSPQLCFAHQQQCGHSPYDGESGVALCVPLSYQLQNCLVVLGGEGVHLAPRPVAEGARKHRARTLDGQVR